jgi:hypothetical protein
MRPIFYAAFCLLALVWYASANLHGYVPFVVNAASAARGQASSFFHK